MATKNSKILLVDDNVAGAQTMGLLLSMTGATVDLASSGEEGVRKAQQGDYTAAILDISLPDISGCEVADRIRRGKRGPIPLLIALSGWGADTCPIGYGEGLFDFYLTKPVNYDDLERILSGPKK
jgi:CheY-like chemotaxis protein